MTHRNVESVEISMDEAMARLNDAVRRLASGASDRAAMRRAADEMDRLSQVIYEQHGLLDIGVPAIRELRDR